MGGYLHIHPKVCWGVSYRQKEQRKCPYTLSMQIGSSKVCHTTILLEGLCQEGGWTHVSALVRLPQVLCTHAWI